jgi:hypothetical protein
MTGFAFIMHHRKQRRCGARTYPNEVDMREAILVLVFLLLVPAFAMAQSAKDSWDSLKRLASGQQIRIVLNDAKSYSGRFQSVSNDGLIVRTGGGEQTFERQTVLRVSTRGKSHRGRNALIGVAVGAGAGVIVAVASPELGTGKCAKGSCVDAGTVSMVGFLGGVLGAGLGAAIPTRSWYDVYRAATKPRK